MLTLMFLQTHVQCEDTKLRLLVVIFSFVVVSSFCDCSVVHTKYDEVSRVVISPKVDESIVVICPLVVNLVVVISLEVDNTVVVISPEVDDSVVVICPEVDNSVDNLVVVSPDIGAVVVSTSSVVIIVVCCVVVGK